MIMTKEEKDRHWKQRELALELHQLRREKKHLCKVGIERSLSEWERMRVLELVTEFRRVNADLKELSHVS